MGPFLTKKKKIWGFFNRIREVFFLPPPRTPLPPPPNPFSFEKLAQTSYPFTWWTNWYVRQYLDNQGLALSWKHSKKWLPRAKIPPPNQPMFPGHVMPVGWWRQRFCPFAPVSRTPRSSCLNGWRSTKASSEYVRYRIYITVLVFQPAELGTLTRRDAGGWGGKQYSTLYSA